MALISSRQHLANAITRKGGHPLRNWVKHRNYLNYNTGTRLWPDMPELHSLFEFLLRFKFLIPSLKLATHLRSPAIALPATLVPGRMWVTTTANPEESEIVFTLVFCSFFLMKENKCGSPVTRNFITVIVKSRSTKIILISFWKKKRARRSYYKHVDTSRRGRNWFMILWEGHRCESSTI